MRVQAKVIRIGNSWGIRLPKTALVLCGLKPGAKLGLEIRQSQLVLRLPGQAVHDDNIKQAYKDVKIIWDEALKDAWIEIFGVDE
jgi:antitoxin component of MazEF toxin-antitoxin module